MKVVTHLPRPPKGGLTPHTVRSITEPGRYGDGYGSFGLSLLVRIGKTGRINKSWNQRLPVEAGRKEIGLGAFPAVSLHAARQKAQENWVMAKAGEDVMAARLPTPTVSEGFDAVIASRRQGWRGETTEAKWRRHQRHCGPILSKPVSKVTTRDVLAIIEPLWHRIPTEANDIRKSLQAVMKWAITKGHRRDNPAPANITENLGRRKPTQHHPSVRYTQLGDVLAKVRDADVPWVVRACLLFLTFTIARSKQARLATWVEIDFDNATWTIPAHRMKTGLPHVVPLATQTIDLLISVQDLTGREEGLIFLPPNDAEFIRPNALSDLLHRVGSPAVPHGMRASFRNWSGRNKNISSEVAEAAMSHSQDKIVAAYLTDEYVEERVDVMQLWLDFITETMGPVVPPDETPGDSDAMADLVKAVSKLSSKPSTTQAKTAPAPASSTS